MLTKLFLLHAVSPLHAGTGHGADVIDLPTVPMNTTGIPLVPGSSIEGVLRDARRSVDRAKAEAVFGPSDDPAAHAGALVVGDARLLALPVRSFRGTFAWTMSPLLLAVAKRDLQGLAATLLDSPAPAALAPSSRSEAAGCTTSKISLGRRPCPLVVPVIH